MKTSYRKLDYTYGAAMYKLRTAIGLTQAGLAKQIGVSWRTVAGWEAGNSYPRGEHLKDLIALGVQAQAFSVGNTAEEIHELWKVAHQKMPLDESWLSALLAQPPLPPVKETPSSAHETRQEKEKGAIGTSSVPTTTPMVPGMAGPASEPEKHADNEQTETIHVGDQELLPILTQPQSIHPSAGQNQNRVRMLRRLHHTYREMMSQSLQGAAWLELGLAKIPDAVQNAANLLWRARKSTRCTEQPLAPFTSITQAYDEAEHELLILGEPGAGKSTLLLALAQQLVLRASQDEAHPLPVILPLSTWAVKSPKFEDWIVEQLVQIYGVPHTLSAQWVRKDAILPLLDGLDEVEETARPACIAAINAYHGSHLLPLVVCSRSAEYEAAVESHLRSKRSSFPDTDTRSKAKVATPVRLLPLGQAQGLDASWYGQGLLSLQSTVVVQPLTHAQVENYLVQAGQQLADLHNALKENPALQELVTTPLMLSVLMLTYQGMKVDHLPDMQTQLQQQVWTDYIARMVEHKGDRRRYSHVRTVPTLRWLARHMQKRNQTMFYLEHLQPDWLEAKQQRNYSWWAVRLPGILIGILVSLLITRFFVGIPTLAFLFQYAVLGGLLGGLYAGDGQGKRTVGTGLAPVQKRVAGLSRSARSTCSTISRTGASPVPTEGSNDLVGANEASPVPTVQNSRERWLIWGKRMGLSLFIGLLFACSFGLNLVDQGSIPHDWLRAGITYLIVFGSICTVIQFFVLRIADAHPLTTPDRPTARWKWLIHFLQAVHVKHVLIIAAVIGLSYGLSNGLLVGLNYGLLVGLSSGLDYTSKLGLSFGLSCILMSIILRGQTSNIQLTERLRWTWSSFSKSLFHLNRLRVLWPLTSGTILFIGLSFGVQTALKRGLSHGLSFGLSTGLSYGLSVGLIYWLLSGLLQGIAQEQIEDQDRRVPNEGTQRSLRNSVIIGIISGGIIGIISMLSFVSVSVLSNGLAFLLSDKLSNALRFGLSKGLSQGPGYGLQVGLLGGLLIFMSMGGIAAFRHYVIRFLLWRTHTLPRLASRFLDDATARFLLRRVGGGYSFAHRLLLDHLADDTNLHSVVPISDESSHRGEADRDKPLSLRSRLSL